jgi:type I restriction enzyme S subunit
MEVETCALAPADWRTRTLEAVCIRVTSGGTPSRSRHDFYVDGVWPWVKTQELQDRWIDQTDERITEEAVANSSAKVLPANTILLAMYGATVGQLGILRRPMACNQACCAMVVDPDRADFRFVFYQLRHSRSQLKSLATGAAQQNLSGALIRSLRLPFPPLPEQRAIASVLGALDDKIELNRRMCQTLEEMARALFKSWFVDFDPVRAKMEGRDPGLPKEIADLFPSRLVNSELGPIPEGWTAKLLGDYFAVGIGGAWGDDEPARPDSIQVRCLRGIDCHDLAEGNLPEVPLRWVTRKQIADRKISQGTLLVEGSGSFCGRSLLWRDEFTPLYHEPVIYSNFCKRLDPVATTSEAFVAWYHMRRAYELGLLVGFRAGTAFPNFDIHGALRGVRIPGPPSELAKRFEQIAKQLVRVDLRTQSATLAALRDTLLPKLISGELRVPASLGSMQEVASPGFSMEQSR